MGKTVGVPAVNHPKKGNATKAKLFLNTTPASASKPATPDIMGVNMMNSFPGYVKTQPGRHKPMAHIPPVVRRITGN